MGNTRYWSDTDEAYKRLWSAVIIQAINDYLSNNKRDSWRLPYVIKREELVSSLHDFFSEEKCIDAIMTRVDEIYESGKTSIGSDI